MTREQILTTLDKPRSTLALRAILNPGGSVEAVQILLMQMRDEKLVTFDIKKGHWHRAKPAA